MGWVDKAMEKIESFIPDDYDQWDNGKYSGLDPIQVEYARRLGEEKALRQQQELMAMQNMVYVGKGETLGNLTGAAGSIVQFGGISGGQQLIFGRTSIEPTKEQVEMDKKRHAKIFIHFAKMFVERFPKWEIVLDETDPFHKARIMRKSDGVIIHNLYPDNQVAVLGGPAAWTEPLKELGQSLPLAKICTQDFYGWALGLEDVPDWIAL